MWRRLELPVCSLDELHLILQTAFGWANAHHYAFHVNGVAHGEPELLGNEPPAGDATDTWLSDVGHQAGD